ncbi:BTB/POZ domain-containing protein 1 [Nilaparvata lugens]|uniref:BTB/POZ domain-containing protein 1 n=1 Tax=Nilaparvata lugens TaxID=108931 RepID=UPI00193DEBEA|nr:BTB/POZ domain-containing protein 1 [Nilaparvata lugens]
MCSLFERESSSQSVKDFFDKRFKRLCISDINSDVEFIVGHEKVSIKGHKLFFSTASEVFYEMLAELSVVELVNIGPEGFKAMKEFIYTGEVSFSSMTHAVSTLVTAKKFLVPLLDLKCIEYIRDKHSSEVLQIYEEFKGENITHFNDTCFELFETITYDILESDGFLSAKSETIDLLLKLESLALSSELELFTFFEKWALAQAEREEISDECLGSHFNGLKKHIRFLTMSPKEFALSASKSLLLTKDEKLDIALNILCPGSTPYPDNLCPIQKKRKFTCSTTWNQL